MKYLKRVSKMTEQLKSRPHDVFELSWPLKSCVLLRECETFDKIVVLSRTAQNAPKIEKSEARRMLKKGFGGLSGSPQAGPGRAKGGQKLCFSIGKTKVS